MKRIMVVGISAGVGKSTFARELGEALDIQVHHLDVLYWKPGWVEAPLEEFRDKQDQLTHQDEWIIDGNYSNSFDIRFARADTMIYLELPLTICLYRVLKRWITNIGNTREDIGEGCPEKIDWPFLKFIVTTYRDRKQKMKKRMQEFERLHTENKAIALTSRKEIDAYLQQIRNHKQHTGIRIS
ncbi:topology modulation protein [Priestia megaterium]|nr:topology modulation protein [Priestia megaterium]